MRNILCLNCMTINGPDDRILMLQFHALVLMFISQCTRSNLYFSKIIDNKVLLLFMTRTRYGVNLCHRIFIYEEVTAAVFLCDS